MCRMHPEVGLRPGLAVVITGGTRGIGAGIARAFLDTGGRVMVCGRTQPADPGQLPTAAGRRCSARPTSANQSKRAA